MNKTDLTNLITTITPASTPEEVQPVYETLANGKGVNRVLVLNAAQDIFQLTGVSGMGVVSKFDRAQIARLLLAKQHGVFDFGALVFPRKDPSGREEGTYTFPEVAPVMAAVELAYAGRAGEIDIASLLPDPQHLGGKPAVVALKTLCPLAVTTAASAAPAADTKKPTTRAPRANKNTASPETPVTEIPVAQPLDTDALALKIAAILAPGLGGGFHHIGKGFHAIGHILTVALQRQEALADRQMVIGQYLDANIELEALPDAPVTAIAALAIAAEELMTSEAEDEFSAAGEHDGSAPAPTPAPAPAPRPTPTPSPVADAKPPAPAPTPAPAPAASGGVLYKEQDLESMDPKDIDLARVDYSDTALRMDGYGIGSLKKVLAAFGEAGGSPIRGPMANRIVSLAKRDGYIK